MAYLLYLLEGNYSQRFDSLLVKKSFQRESGYYGCISFLLVLWCVKTQNCDGIKLNILGAQESVGFSWSLLGSLVDWSAAGELGVFDYLGWAYSPGLGWLLAHLKWPQLRRPGCPASGRRVGSPLARTSRLAKQRAIVGGWWWQRAKQSKSSCSNAFHGIKKISVYITFTVILFIGQNKSHGWIQSEWQHIGYCRII